MKGINDLFRVDYNFVLLSLYSRLLNWLRKWFENRSGKKALQKPNPWAKNDDGSYYKAALLSGPPGIGM